MILNYFELFFIQNIPGKFRRDIFVNKIIPIILFITRVHAEKIPPARRNDRKGHIFAP